MGITPVGTERDDVRGWLDTVSKEETHIYVAVAISSKDDEMAKIAAGQIKSKEMLILRQLGYEQAEEVEVVESDTHEVRKYIFRWTEWKRKVMGCSVGGKTPADERRYGPNEVEDGRHLWR